MSLDLEYYSSICDFEIVIDIPELQFLLPGQYWPWHLDADDTIGVVFRQAREYCHTECPPLRNVRAID
jgi:hypothetical protein